jgi:hypothetical protein
VGAEQPALARNASGQGATARASAKAAPAANADAGKRDDRRAQVKEMAQRIAREGRQVTIEGYAGAGEEDAETRSLARANNLRNQLIELGAPPALLAVKGSGAVEGRPAGVRLVAADSAQPAAAAQPENAIGESHFESGTPMSVKSGKSVMVSLVDQETRGEVVYLFDAESERGNDRFAFKAMRLQNPTESTLETGPLTVYGHGRFVGEGLADPIPPHAIAVVPFALDRQVVVERTQSTGDQIQELVSLERGILTTQVRHRRSTIYKVSNRLGRTERVYVRHTVQPGWQLLDAPVRRERIGTAHLFLVELKAGETRDVTIEEVTPLTRTIDLRAPEALEQVSLYLNDATRDKQLGAQIDKLLALHREVVDHQTAIDNLRGRLGSYRERLDELHAQVVTLRAVGSGAALVKHLSEKMREISDRVQKLTIEVVDREEAMLVAQVRFQDGVAELALAPAAPQAPVRAASTP